MGEDNKWATDKTLKVVDYQNLFFCLEKIQSKEGSGLLHFYHICFYNICKVLKGEESQATRCQVFKSLISTICAKNLAGQGYFSQISKSKQHLTSVTETCFFLAHKVFQTIKNVLIYEQGVNDALMFSTIPSAWLTTAMCSTISLSLTTLLLENFATKSDFFLWQTW